MNSVAYETTVSSPIIIAGIGVHSGVRSRMVIKPAAPGTGIVFVRTDLDADDPAIPARGDHVTEAQLGTTLSNDSGVSVAVVEHFLAACAGMGLDNARVEIEGPELPIMDGSSAVFCETMSRAGLLAQAAPRRRIRILETIDVSDGAKSASLSPSTDNYLTLRARIDFKSAAIGVQQIALRLRPGMFARDLAFARTFGFARDVDTLKAMGLARGGSLDNAVVVDGDEIVNPEGLRVDDEFVRHKVLDAVGDLFLAGGQIAGIYEANQPGHALNNALVRKLLKSPSAWCWEADEAPALATGAHLQARA